MGDKRKWKKKMTAKDNSLWKKISKDDSSWQTNEDKIMLYYFENLVLNRKGCNPVASNNVRRCL